jgi:hypothetical protein
LIGDIKCHFISKSDTNSENSEISYIWKAFWTTDWNSKTRQNQCTCPKCSGSSKLLFPAIYRVDTCFCFDIRIRFFNFPLPTYFYLRSPLFYIISWKIYYPKSRIIFLNFISFQWFCQFYFIFILFSLKWPCYL